MMSYEVLCKPLTARFKKTELKDSLIALACLAIATAWEMAAWQISTGLSAKIFTVQEANNSGCVNLFYCRGVWGHPPQETLNF